MATIQSERDEYLMHLEHQVDELQSRFQKEVRAATHDDAMETLARVERAKRSVAAKGDDLDTLMEEASNVPEDEWDDTHRRLEGAWREYREAVDRLELELEREDELR